MIETAVLLDGLVLVALLAIGMGDLVGQGRALARLLGLPRLRLVLAVLVIAPLAALLLIGALALTVWQASQGARLEHALLLAGLWTSVTVGVLAVLAALRGGARPPVWAVGLIVLAGAPVIYFTPIGHFLDAFGPDGAPGPAIDGGLLLILCYVLVVRLYRHAVA